MNGDRLFRGRIFCSLCAANGKRLESWSLIREPDGTYTGRCHDHRHKKSDPGEMAVLNTVLSFPWEDVVQLTIHKAPINSPRYDGDKLVTVRMKDVENVELMRLRAIEVLHGLQLMIGHRTTIHDYGTPGEGNHCWTQLDWNWERPVHAHVRNKYWGEDHIQAFFKACRLMAELHNWELDDETRCILDRIVDAVER